MRNEKKDFFYNPFWRVFVYTISLTFLWCFRAIALTNPRLNRVVERYEDGHLISGAIIGFTSGLIPSVLLLLLTHKHVNWSFDKIITYLIAYLLIGLMGWLSLAKLRDYEQEKWQGKR